MKYDIEYEIWRFDELYHGFEMDAKENLPAGSMLAEYDDSAHYVVQRFFHREETGKTKKKEDKKKKQKWLWYGELGNWRMSEFVHQMDMDARDNLPAGSMTNISGTCGYESYYVPSEFYREERK